MKLMPNIIPVGGEEPIHVCGVGCWCDPFDDGKTVIHHAKDKRDLRERNGTNRPEETWVTIFEGRPS